MPIKVIAKNLKFNFTVSGKGTPIVLLHALGGHPHGWHEYAASLAEHHTVIVPNLNHLLYANDRISFCQQVELLTDFLRDLAKEYGVLNIVGQSYSGTLAIGVAIKDKDLVDRIILINPFPPWPVHYFRNSFLRFFMRTSALLSQLKSGLLKTGIGLHFLKELKLVFPWPWLQKMVSEENFKSSRFELFHHEMERFAWILQKENWEQWDHWQIPSNRSMLIYDANDPLFKAEAYPDLINKFKFEHTLKLKKSGHLLVNENKFEILLSIRRFLEPSYLDEFKLAP